MFSECENNYIDNVRVSPSLCIVKTTLKVSYILSIIHLIHIMIV